jgi:hypothetical protein
MLLPNASQAGEAEPVVVIGHNRGSAEHNMCPQH